MPTVGSYGVAVSYEQGTPVAALYYSGGWARKNTVQPSTSVGRANRFRAMQQRLFQNRFPESQGQDLTLTVSFATFAGQLQDGAYKGTSLIRNSSPVGPYRRTMPRLLWRS